MTTLVLCLDRNGEISRGTGAEFPVTGWEAVRSLVVDLGLADPESSSVNTVLESLRVTRKLQADGDDAAVAVISGGTDSVVSADRSVAQQLDAVITACEPDAAVLIVDSAEDERLVPIVESRIPVDSVDRVVVRQAHDIESTYYLLKQFLADEELRQTTLVPLGMALVVFPVLAYLASVAFAAATIVTVIGLFLLFKGFRLEEHLEALARQLRQALYSGNVSVVTYVVAAGLLLLGVSVGLLGLSDPTLGDEPALLATQFTYDSIPWLVASGLTATMGRLLDNVIATDEPVRMSFINLPFFILGVGVIIRGFTGYFLELANATPPAVLPAVVIGPISVESIRLDPGQRLAAAVGAGVAIAFVGVRVASYLGSLYFETADVTGE